MPILFLSLQMRQIKVGLFERLPAEIYARPEYDWFQMEELRKSLDVFACDADVWTVDTWDDAILGIIRAKGNEKLVALFNFSEQDKTAWINEDDGMYTDLLSERKMEAKGVDIPGYGVYWLYKKM